jgi:Xaa-Pro aminopeptidase
MTRAISKTSKAAKRPKPPTQESAKNLKTGEALLIVADSERDPNMLYASGLFAPDPFTFFQTKNKAYLLLSDLEIDRGKATSPHCDCLSLTAYQKKCVDAGLGRPKLSEIVGAALLDKNIRVVWAPETLPVAVARDLERQGIEVQVREGLFFPEREFKTADEIKYLTQAQRTAEAGMEAAVEVLKEATVGPRNRILWRGKTLTSEKLHEIIFEAALRQGGIAAHTIAAGGLQAVDPHDRGSGPLQANRPIIIDIFPRVEKTGYFGDITRTFVKGKASDAAWKLFEAVGKAQKAALNEITNGVATEIPHLKVHEVFSAEGYKTGRIDGRMQGYYHGTGHGVGMEIHEMPRMGKQSVGLLQTGQVITVEPGLYYSEIGGVRLEDMVLVTDKRPKNLTRFPKFFEIP